MFNSYALLADAIAQAGGAEDSVLSRESEKLGPDSSIAVSYPFEEEGGTASACAPSQTCTETDAGLLPSGITVEPHAALDTPSSFLLMDETETGSALLHSTENSEQRAPWQDAEVGPEGSHQSVFSPLLAFLGQEGSSLNEGISTGLHTGDVASIAPMPSDEEGEIREGYQFGDITRSLISSAIPHIREFSHTAKDKFIKVKERHYEVASDIVRGLIDGEEASNPNAPHSGDVEARRWWAAACKAAHQGHRNEADAGGTWPAHRGWLEIELLAFSATPPVMRPDGLEAAEPICQFSLGGCYTGALHPMGEEHEQEQGKVSVVRFPISETTGSDVRVHVFDRASSQFDMGLEENAFCGGALVPLALVMQHGISSECGVRERWFCRTFTLEVTLRLLPLEVLWMRSKLESAELGSGIPAPKLERGHVLLRFQMHLP